MKKAAAWQAPAVNSWPVTCHEAKAGK
jgi:hypothetical protein